METILIVDDEKNYPLILSAVLEEEGFETVTANSGQEALQALDQAEVDLIITDMKMPGMDGIALLEHIKKRDAQLPVIMMTAYGTVEKAVEAMQKGAYNYILKPFENESLIIYVNKAIEMHRMVKENRLLRNSIASHYSFGNIIGKSSAMKHLFKTIQKIAPASATVLIEGENGTGKELVAKSIHFNSSRKKGPFIAVNCSALSEHLLESELFGHEKGAFTSAGATKKGRFEMADTGTLFLDEIGELSQPLQVKLLRVLQERVCERVGGTKQIPLDIRIIAATNKRLKNEVAGGRFREDLFYRLNVLHLVLPPLRERTEDIRLLVQHFIEKYKAERNDAPAVKGVAQEAMRSLYEYRWPGNVRELENVIERAMILCPDDMIKIQDFPKHFQPNTMSSIDIKDNITFKASLSDTLAEVEKKIIIQALEKTNYVQTHAAKLLGIGKSGLNQKIKKYRLDIRQKK